MGLISLANHKLELSRFDEAKEELTLVLQVYPNEGSAVEYLFHCAPPSSESILLFGQKFLCLTFQ
ncbi:hypothetical protein DPMN_058747 [Dreissena polymorpha]|uniref:Uncharacterized protein n=1 Tax=Dreissena polymorpha TaxID=45954 RepID=A0A9D4HGH1_DREPO|nr:hypothetical protein DPMN_058747 [Dreissena polymorpha]